jgi:hypothetical protein
MRPAARFMTRPRSTSFVLLLAAPLIGVGLAIAIALFAAARSEPVRVAEASRNKPFSHQPWDYDFTRGNLPKPADALARFDRLTALPGTTWAPTDGTPEYSNFQHLIVSRGPALETEDLEAFIHFTTQTGGVAFERVRVISIRAGWPFPVLQAHSFEAVAIKPAWFSAGEYPAWMVDKSSALTPRHIPATPIWSGLFANAAIFGGVVLLAFPVRRAIIRRSRLRRNHCPACGYDRNAHAREARCPECGLAPAAPSLSPLL